MSAIGLVMAREIRLRLRAPSFAITTALLCIAVLGAGVLHRALSGDDPPTRYELATVGARPAGFDEALDGVASALGIEIEVRASSSRADAERVVRDGDVDAAIDVGSGELVSADRPPEAFSTAVSAAWQSVRSRAAAAAAGLDDVEIGEVLAPAPLASVLLEAADDDGTLADVVGFSAAILLFISINVFGGNVLTGVVEEKTTGVVEVLLGHVRAHHLLSGKVLGIGVVAMMQLLAAMVCGVVALWISGITIPVDVWVGLATSLVWFVGGFVLYSTLFAFAGSCVSRQEDAQGAAAPISVVFTLAYIAVFSIGTEPTSTVTRVVSVLPPFAPLLMPLRVAAGAASVVEIVVALVGLLLATSAMLRLAGSVYGRTLLHRGARLRWRQALRMRSS